MNRLFATALTGLLGLGLISPMALASKDALTHQGVLNVEDNANAFTQAGIKKAEDSLHGTKFRAATEMTVVTYAKVPDPKRADYEKVKGDKADKAIFFGDWARELAKARNTRGVFVLVSKEGGHVHAIDDRQGDVYRKFDDKDLKALEKKIADGFAKATPIKEPELAKAARDEGLLHGVQFVAGELKNTTVPDEVEHRTNASTEKSSGGLLSGGIMSYVCLGIVVLLGIWLVVGLIRMFTGGGGGGGGGGGYGGGGYGGGGGGFMTGLIGGMFGAAAGMYMYDQFFHNDHGSSASAGDTTGDAGNTGDTGAGDYDGGGDGGGTDYDAGDGGGDTGGGDFGGGDGGGGGDFGGGDW